MAQQYGDILAQTFVLSDAKVEALVLGSDGAPGLGTVS
jgi:hypothetical protein